MSSNNNRNRREDKSNRGSYRTSNHSQDFRRDSNRRGSFERDNSGDNRSFGRNEYSDKRGDRPQRGGFRPSSDSSNRSSRNFSVRRGREDGRGREERDNQRGGERGGYQRGGERGGYQRGGERGGYQRDRRDYNYDRPKESVFRSRRKKLDLPSESGIIRLNRYIANAGICSRRKADELIEAGVITVNDEVVTELGTKVDTEKDVVKYNGERLKREKKVYVLLNKPKDYITTTNDPQERKIVMDIVKKATKERIYPVGRLDRNTTGLLLLTNDGALAEKLAHPRNEISKIYHVHLDKNLSQGDFNKIEFGLELEDGFIKPDEISYIPGASKREVGIQIHSGKNRIVRRIFESLGYDVVQLDRTVYGSLTKKDLPRAKWRYLTEKEIRDLKTLVK
ncbi:MAG TPA: pseudouridine synthase [Candidatus Sphingobacterium stercoripullorum]|uniref:Pseudouridine synthase n=1 Tax=Candidatus Sphingobacterium stercoripullorum TaxID=2838759 RepID=A0A9D2AXQ1_9SPHI|nr:pseudouridine synthase [Candidatus Sphingobacterium stercoripullorum]